MDFQDFIVPPRKIKYDKWKLGAKMTDDLPENGLALLFVSDFRGANGSAESANIEPFRRELYKLSGYDFDLPMYDFGDLISGKTLQDTHYVIQEVVSSCLYKKTVPVIIGGGNDISFSLFSALNFHDKNISYTQISNVVSLSYEGEDINEKNFLSRLFSSKNFSIKNYHHLGYQKHLNELDSVKLIEEVEFDVVRLAEMMNTAAKTEPYLRNADLVTVNCDAVESFCEPFSINPQVNGLNRREICMYMKEIGLGKNLKSIGIFNINFETEDILNQQLLSQMVWYLFEGINIQKTHPVERSYETFWVLISDEKYAFKRDTFSNLWYFGTGDDIEECLPCSQEDYENAKKGYISARLFNFLNR